MPLEKDLSLVADSTTSSSPFPGPEIKRAARTYGRRREEPPAGGIDLSISTADPSLSFRDSVHNTAPPGLSEEVPPSSPQLTPLSDGGDGDDGGSVGEKFEFNWKKRLREMDEDIDIEKSSSLPVPKDVPSHFGLGTLSLLRSEASASPKTSIGTNIPTGVHEEPPASSLNTSASSPVVETYSLSSPPVPSRPRVRKQRVIHDSDSEPEHSKSSPSTTPASLKKNLFNTPKSGSSSTQPTSDDEVPASILTKKSSRERSKPPASLRPSVLPLDFTKDPANEITSRKGKKGRSTKLKAPTKRDIAETVKERGRLAAQTAISIPRAEKKAKFTIQNLFSRVQGQIAGPSKLDAGDPIDVFSSPVNDDRPFTKDHTPHVSPKVREPSISTKPMLQEHDSDSDLDLPDMDQVIREAEEKRRIAQFKEMKEMLLAQQRAASNTMSDDDDLEIVVTGTRVVVKEEAEQRRSATKPRISETRKRQMQLAKVGAVAQEMKSSSPAALHGTGGTAAFLYSKAPVGKLNHATLNRMMAAEVRKEAQNAIQTKQEIWAKYGGRVRQKSENNARGFDDMVKAIAEKGIQMAEEQDAGALNMDDEDNGEDEDEDWDPNARGSASPEPDDDHNMDQDDTTDGDITAPGVSGSQDENDENVLLVRPKRRLVAVSDSEDEDSSKDPVLSARESYHYAALSSDPSTEDEHDKENNTRLMFDRSEDKENTAVVRHLTDPGITIASSSFSPPPSLSTWRHETLDRGLNEERSEQRKPFKDLLADESPATSHLQPAISFTEKLQQTSPLARASAPSASLKPVFGLDSRGFGELTFTQGDTETITAPCLQPGFSELFESETQKDDSRRGKGLDGNERRGLQRADTIDLTQDITLVNLQPAFQVDEKARKADTVFEKEQALVLETAIQKPPQTSKSELYVNDLGFLTQTRPDIDSPEVYRALSPSQRQAESIISPSQIRPPLRTLSLTSPPQSPEHGRLRRLKKHSTPPPGFNDSSLDSVPPVQKLSAFDVLGRKPTKHKSSDKKLRFMTSEFFENEAAESDEDDMFGFAKPKDAEEEEGEDLDKTLDVLMDDRAMNEATVAAELVHKKFMEQEEEADKANEELHMAATKGELRRKRTRGVGVDDSDEESDGEDNDRARRAMKRLRTSDRGDIKDLAANEATRAFANTYNQSLKDDDLEFAYLDKETQLEDIVMDKREDEDDGEYEEAGEEERETISRDEIHRKIREGVTENVINPNDVSWVDCEAQDDGMPVRTISRRRPLARLQDADTLEVDGSMGPPNYRKDMQMSDLNKQWFKQEKKSRNAGTSRSVGASAVTGHAKSKPRTGDGPHRTSSKRDGEAASLATVSKPVKVASSMLSVMADKSGLFE